MCVSGRFAVRLAHLLRRTEVVSMIKAIRIFLLNEEGITVAEYAVAGALLVGAGIIAFTLLGGNVDAQVRAIAAAIT